MDLSKLSDSDLMALASNDISKVSDEGLVYIASQPAPKVDQKNYPNSTKAAFLHAANMASGGYLPQIEASVEPGIRKTEEFLTGKEQSGPFPNYVQNRDANIQILNQLEKENPKSALLGKVIGIGASAIPMGKAIMALPGISSLIGAEALPTASTAGNIAALTARTGGAALTAGMQGAIINPGDEPGKVDVLQFPERAKNSALSALIAIPTNVAAEGVSAGAKALSDKFSDLAEKSAFRALGPFKRQVNQNRDQIQNIGREALDHGIVRAVPTNAEGIEQRAAQALEGTGEKLGDLTEALIGKEGEFTSSGIQRGDIANNLREKLLVDNPGKIPGVNERNNFFQKMISEFEGNNPNDQLSFADLRNMKQTIQGTKNQAGFINWNRLKGADIPQEEQFYRALASELRNGEEQGAKAIAQASGMGENFKQLKEEYSALTKAAEIAGNRADSQRANHILGLRDAILMGSGAATGASIGGAVGSAAGMPYEGAKIGAIIGGLGSKLAREYGAQVGAKALDLTSKAMSHVPSIMTPIQNNPTILPQIILENSSPIERRLKQQGAK